jgi:hypothetical protein
MYEDSILFAELYITRGNPDTLNLTSNVFDTLSDLTLGETQGFSFVGSTLTYTGRSKYFLINHSMSVESGSNNQFVISTIRINGSNQTKAESLQEEPTANVFDALGSEGIFFLENGDTIVPILSGSVTNTYIVRSYHLTITPI